MPKCANGLTYRQERFCRHFAAGSNATTAAADAGYGRQWCRTHGNRLLRQPRIRARVAAIQAEMARESCDGMAVLLGKLESIYRTALQSNNYQAAARAVDLQARLVMRMAAAAPGEAGQVVDLQRQSGKMSTNGYIVPDRSGESRFFFSTCTIPARPESRHPPR